MTILDKLLDCFEKAKSEPFPVISKSTYTSFLLGSKLGVTYQKSHLSDKKKNGSGWSTDEIKLFINTPESDWDVKTPTPNSEKFPFQKFCSAKVVPHVFKQHVEQLIKEYFPNEEPSFTSGILKKLCAYAFFGTPYPNTLFEPYEHGTLSNYVSWDTRESDIKKSLETNKLIFISGTPASGKTLITKKVLKDYYTTSSDICFITIEDISFSDGLTRLPFIDGAHDLESVLSYLRKKTERSCLVVKKPFLTKVDFEFVDKNLSDLAMKVIILTQMDFESRCYPCFSLQDRPEENLRRIYEASRKEMDLTKDEFKELLKIISNNPYVLSLVGKALNNERNLKKDPQLKEKFLNKTTWIDNWNTTSQAKAHGNYRVKNSKSEQALPLLISHILDSYGDTTIYSPLAVWAKAPVTKKFLIKYGGISIELINEALRLGILELDSQDNETVFMPSLMADTIWRKHSDSSTYSKYCKELTEFLHLLHIGNDIQVPYKTLYNVIRVLLQRFHFQLSTFKPRKNPRKNSDFMEWNRLLIQLIHRLTDLGEYKTAEVFLPYLFLYMQEKEIRDAADSDERLIRDMLHLKAHHLQHSITSNNVNYLIAYFNNAKENFLQTIQHKESLGLHFVILEFENLLNYMIRVETSYLIKSAYLKLFNPSERTQALLYHLQEYILLKNKLCIIDNSYYYYFFIYESLKNIYSADVLNWYNNSGETHINNLLSLNKPDYELVLQVKCQHLFYKLLFLLKRNPQNAWLTNEFQELQSEYNELSDYLKNKMIPWGVIFAFSSSCYIFYHFKSTLGNCTLSHVVDSFKSFEKHATNQLTLPTKEQELFLDQFKSFTFILDTTS